MSESSTPEEDSQNVLGGASTSFASAGPLAPPRRRATRLQNHGIETTVPETETVSSSPLPLTEKVSSFYNPSKIEARRGSLARCEPSADAGSSASVDKPDNRDTFGFLEAVPPADMCREEERLKTFEKWPVPFLSPELLASNGFYYLGRGDEVRCAFCKVEIMRWEQDDDPALDHQRWAPQCPFLRHKAGSGNVPCAGTDAGRDECGVRAPPAVVARTPGPVHAKYNNVAARLRSFKDWPRSMRQKPEDLANAGFFYTGQGDKTKCFYCDGGLKDWELEDDPWEQHARWFDRCAYVTLVKGNDYVQKVITEARAIPAEKASAPPEELVASAPVATAPPLTPEPVDEDDSKLCKICFAEERNVAFVPCGHVVACAKCALSTDKCPMCRRTFHNAVRIYFS